MKRRVVGFLPRTKAAIYDVIPEAGRRRILGCHNVFQCTQNLAHYKAVYRGVLRCVLREETN